MIKIFLGLAAGILSANAATFTGIITDTMCGAKHEMMKDQPDGKCIAMCVKGSDQYALYDGKSVWKLSDQKLPARFSTQRVTVTGELNEKSKTIKVTSIQAAPAESK
jgi:hypothetical protein